MISNRFKYTDIISTNNIKKWFKTFFLGFIIMQLSACNPLQTEDKVQMVSNPTQIIDTLPINEKQKSLLYFYAQIIENTITLDIDDSLAVEKVGSEMLLLAGCSMDYFENLSDFIQYADNVRAEILDTDAKREKYTKIENSDEVAMASPSTDMSCDDIVETYTK